MRGPVVNRYRLIERLPKFTGRTINHQTDLLLDPPVNPLNLASTLRMIGFGKVMLDPVNRKILGKNLGSEA